jgi:beta-galactosidase
LVDVAANWRNITGREYRHVRDVLRFKVEHNLERIQASAQQFQDFNHNAPYRGGGEIGLFNPIAWYGVDMAGIANVLTNYGSFYPSMHFSWHFGQVNHELTRSLYQQASLMNDLFKGGWTGGWESTGGPQQLDGERSASDKNAYYVETGELMQLYLAQLAAGFRGFGIWCWNGRSAGKEGGEYSLLDRNGQITERAIAIGKLGQAMQKFRFELWNAHKEPLVGVLYDWENEALWATMSIPGRDHYKDRPVRARVGTGRALTNANVPFEYVTPEDLKKGLGPRYRVLYLPGFLCLRTDMMPVLTDYVRGEAGW